jgi:hypothetical protein
VDLDPVGSASFLPDRDRHPGPADPDPDLYPFQPKEKKNVAFSGFSQKISI